MTLLLGFVILFASWLAPGHYNPWVNFQNEVLAAAAALLVGFAAVGSARESRLPWPRLALFVMLVATVPLLQTAAGQIRFLSDGVLASAYVAGLALCIVTGATLVQTRREEFLGGLFGALLAAGLVSTGMAALQWLEVGPIPYLEPIAPGERPYANLVQPNHLATLLGLALVGALWLFETRRINGAVLGLAAAWLCLGLAMSRSRTPWLFVLLFAASWLWMRRRAAVRLGATALNSALALFVAAVLAWGPLSRALDVVAPISVVQRMQGGGGRLNIWLALLDSLWASPWVGYGWSQVSRAALVSTQNHYVGEQMLRNSHNVVIDLLVWNGLPLGLLIVAMLVWWFVRQVRECRDAERWLLLVGISVVAIHALLEYPLEYLYFLLPVGLMVGAVEGWEGGTRSWRISRASLFAPLVAMAAFTGWVAVEYTRIEEASRQGLMLMAGYARNAAPPDVLLLDGPREYIRLWKTTAQPGMQSGELEWMRNVVERNPSPPALLRYAAATGLNGRPQDAADTLVRLCNMHRTARCEEGRASWRQLQSIHPALAAIAYPRTPAPP